MKDKIIQLEEICVSVEEAKELNNSENAPFAWVYNPHKNFPEFELVPVRDIVSATPALTIVMKDNNWTLYPTNVFVAWEQVQELIKKGEFFFAPLKLAEANENSLV